MTEELNFQAFQVIIKLKKTFLFFFLLAHSSNSLELSSVFHFISRCVSDATYFDGIRVRYVNNKGVNTGWILHTLSYEHIVCVAEAEAAFQTSHLRSAVFTTL